MVFCGSFHRCLLLVVFVRHFFQINRPYNLQCFLNENTVFTDAVKFDYQPQDNDSVSY